MATLFFIIFSIVYNLVLYVYITIYVYLIQWNFIFGYPFFYYLFYCIQFSFICLYYYIRIFDTMEFYFFYFPASQLCTIELYSIIWCFLFCF
nr:MAG TPA: hypothetical protein [Caudoviricetes sp.]